MEVYFFSILYKNHGNCIEITVLSRVDSELNGGKKFQKEFQTTVLDITCRENNETFETIFCISIILTGEKI